MKTTSERLKVGTSEDTRGYFGPFGGRFVPETLTHALDELDAAYRAIAADEAFQRELDALLAEYVGRPTPLYPAARLSAHCGGARVYLKREDLAHTGAHKINNAIGQALLARRMGKRRIIAETGAGQHGVATATACALLGLECCVYMGSQDVRRQRMNALRMRLLGAELIPVETGSRTLKDAINEAIRDWVTNVETTHYVIGSVVGPAPYPRMVRDFQCVIGRETRRQALERDGRLPDVVYACVGGGSNAIGMFHPFVADERVRLVGVEAAGAATQQSPKRQHDEMYEQGPKRQRPSQLDEQSPARKRTDSTPAADESERGSTAARGPGSLPDAATRTRGPLRAGQHAATLAAGTVGVLHGARSYLLQDEHGQVLGTHSISAGLDYPGVGPEHAYLRDSGRAEYTIASDEEALAAMKLLCRTEGIIPALESSHALAAALRDCASAPPEIIVVNLSGRGDKDLEIVEGLV